MFVFSTSMGSVSIQIGAQNIMRKHFVKNLIVKLENVVSDIQEFANFFEIGAFVNLESGACFPTKLTRTRLSCFNVKTNCFILENLISLVRLKLIISLG